MQPDTEGFAEPCLSSTLLWTSGGTTSEPQTALGCSNCLPQAPRTFFLVLAPFCRAARLCCFRICLLCQLQQHLCQLRELLAGRQRQLQLLSCCNAHFDGHTQPNKQLLCIAIIVLNLRLTTQHYSWT
jgi:hypothetical protein